MMQRKKIIIISCIVGAVVALLLITLSTHSVITRVTTGATFIVSPTTSTINLDEAKIKKAGFFKHKLAPGEYTVNISAPNFTSQSVTFTVKSDEITTVYVKLDPTNEVGKQLLRTESEARVREEIAANQYYQAAADQQESNPIIKYLPAVTADWRVDYGNSNKPDDPSAITVFITTYNDQDREAALNWIRSRSIDLASLTIVYRYFEDSSNSNQPE